MPSSSRVTVATRRAGRAVRAGVLLLIAHRAVLAQGGAMVPRIPLCAGLTITTAVSQPNGDYESIKTIRSISSTEVQLSYSSEAMRQDMFDEKPRLVRTNVRRVMRRTDLDTASLYLQQFGEFVPERAPGTTSIGTSAAVLRALKSKGHTALGLFLPFAGPVSDIPGEHPSVYDHQVFVPVHRAGATTIPVVVDDRRVELPAIRVAGDFLGDSAELFFLDDPANPLTLAYRYGIGGIKQEDLDLLPHLANGRKGGDDKDVMRVVKISTRCSAPPPADRASGESPDGAGRVDPLEEALVLRRKVDVFQLFFAFNSDTLRDESLPTLTSIATLMRRHSEWVLRIDGHTDNVASDTYNLTLSRRRATAVKRALVTRYGVAEGRLQSEGVGEARPIDANDTLHGRARNRRVELVRVDR